MKKLPQERGQALCTPCSQRPLLFTLVVFVMHGSCVLPGTTLTVSQAASRRGCATPRRDGVVVTSRFRPQIGRHME